MLRCVAIALMLSPGIAHAQKFVSVEGDSDPALVSSTQESTSDPVATDADPVAVIDLSAYGDSVVFDGATIEQIEALLANADGSALSADEQNAIVARVETTEDGQSVLTLDVSGSGTTTNAEGTTVAGSDVANLELGECNEGTNWVSNEVNCYNAYPSVSD
ncbi:hypothetical protein SAMN05444004_10462 [Jannaschia faecimaris]|uniref:Uncharacterized protein n=1 Tax=Jannaschia faecimaris TaxID=1244108 RepID=A0A1H3NQB5_9RHOB|nr:hypothetical protein [Jannaschia faecimaris]SDY90870.1 hypothetical protein SAMN05444004_10462 [Jannaschia faecimaris]